MHPTRIFKHPDELLKAWEDYKTERDLEARKWAKIQYVGKDGKEYVKNSEITTNA